MGEKKVLLIMNRKILSDALIEQAKGAPHFDLRADRSHASAVLTAAAYGPEIVVMEVPESGPWKSAEKCISICDAIREQVPGCKQVLLCPENDADACRAAIRAKRNNRIDDFLYYDTSLHYLFSKLESLLH